MNVTFQTVDPNNPVPGTLMAWCVKQHKRDPKHELCPFCKVCSLEYADPNKFAFVGIGRFTPVDTLVKGFQYIQRAMEGD
ncbi:hypothetical protein FACS1894109_15640 [Spirochaetia bacterium]|nr:hypothetical protein FACS1894109_15640 [Spirochaetia bacterium]